ncbi:hypothetical protein CHCC14809_3710 [Bacillus licheniformis]|nr:hypothetical protein CHCC20495_2161 [Bacillus licheniformis]TWJ99315.1 hypothetical protein CHCC20493_1855 [Bacillus licheniformis]TWK20686.1 hypothetical protein CHCC20373_0367 [Bacillus licheniformis]TWK30093.1 hypothetical protein CHCC20369_1440 [Bacillus licheniformis]TWK33871.1 hypothetical protein CHCC20368_0353 [Bacillus licheniformis]
MFSTGAVFILNYETLSISSPKSIKETSDAKGFWNILDHRLSLLGLHAAKKVL